MKVQLQLLGTFRRTLISGLDVQPVSLVDLMREIQAVATQTRRISLPVLHQSFGLDFLPQPILLNLLEQANGVATENQLYQVPYLQRLHPVESNLTPQVANTYSYQFISPEATFNLTPDNPQLPTFTGSDSEQPGIYTITLDSPQHPYLPDAFTQRIWQQATQQSLVPQNLSVNSFEIPAQLNPEQTLSPAQGLVIGRGNSRSGLRRIISEAQQFLLISSYRIEDEEITELICQKSRQLDLPPAIPPLLKGGLGGDLPPRGARGDLPPRGARGDLPLPQGVWILTDLRNEVIESLDIQVSNNAELRQEYQRSRESKKACLRMLLDANIPIRSGAFHLKTYISEQYAYLGSCNLTKGSLDFNLEAGIVWRNTPSHAQLINFFRHFWEQRSQDEVIPVSNLDGFHLRSINPSPEAIYETGSNLLTPYQYSRDLIKELTNFRGKVQIYTRSFQPSPEISRLLYVLDTRVFVHSQLVPSNSRLNIHPLNNLHAKITLLGNKVAYIGGINFNFTDSASSLIDLMYKTTDSAEINKIARALI